MNKKNGLSLFLAVFCLLAAMYYFGSAGTTGFLTVAFFVIGVGCLNFERYQEQAKAFFGATFFTGLLYLYAIGATIPQVLALGGGGIIASGIFTWNKNKVQGGTQIFLGLAIALFGQYIRVVILGG